MTDEGQEWWCPRCHTKRPYDSDLEYGDQCEVCGAKLKQRRPNPRMAAIKQMLIDATVFSVVALAFVAIVFVLFWIAATAQGLYMATQPLPQIIETIATPEVLLGILAATLLLSIWYRSAYRRVLVGDDE